MLPALAALAAAALPVLLVWAAAVDIFNRRIPNGIPVLIGISFAVCATTSNLPFPAALSHLICFLFILACGFTLFAFSVIGGGDAKLLAVMALWSGFDGLSLFLVRTTIAGAALALAYAGRNAACDALGLHAWREKTIPYGVAIAASALSVLPNWMSAF